MVERLFVGLSGDVEHVGGVADLSGRGCQGCVKKSSPRLHESFGLAALARGSYLATQGPGWMLQYSPYLRTISF